MNYEELAKKTAAQQEELDQLRRTLNDALQAIHTMQKDKASQQSAEVKQEEAQPRPRWSPPAGLYAIALTNYVRGMDAAEKSVQGLLDVTWDEVTTKTGRVRSTVEKANYDAAEMLQHNLLLAYRAQFAPDYEVPPQGTEAWYVRPGENEREGRAAISSSRRRVYGLVYFPRSAAQSLADKINSGEMVL